MNSRFSKYILCSLGLLLLLSGCQSLDDDSVYEIKTHASFFLVAGQGAGLSIHRYKDHALEADWNVKAGVANADLSDVDMVDNVIWIASGSQKTLLQVSPSYGSVKEKFDGLPLSPHYIAVGKLQVMIVDTVAQQIALVKRRNGKTQVLEFTGRPGRCLYNSGKFYLCQDSNQVAVYDEEAMTVRAKIDLGVRVDEILLDRYHVITVMCHDTAGTRQGLIDANGDFLVRGTTTPVNFALLRPTPYFAVRFGREFLHDLRIVAAGIVRDNGELEASRATDCEADFFESTLFYPLDGHLVVKDMAADSLLDSIPFQGALIKSMHQYADE